jgi:hypothetical protein
LFPFSSLGNAALTTSTGEGSRQSVFFAHPMPLTEAGGGTAPLAELYRAHKSTSLVMEEFIESRYDRLGYFRLSLFCYSFCRL